MRLPLSDPDAITLCTATAAGGDGLGRPPRGATRADRRRLLYSRGIVEADRDMDAAFRQQLFRFIATGLTATAVDAGLYFGLIHGPLPGAYNAAKATAFLFGTLVSFLLNKYWTFGASGRNPGETGRFLALYGTTFAVNVGVNRAIVAAGLALALPQGRVEFAGWFLATGCSTTLNFFGQKFWVFAGSGRAAETGP